MPWIARGGKPQLSLKALITELKLNYFEHTMPMQRTLEKTLMTEKMEIS